MATIMMVIMIGLLLLGFPMMVPLITGAVVGFVMMFDGFGQMGTFVQQMMGGIRPASLIAVPMFILAADIMTRGQSADRLIHMVMAFIGHIKGGLAISTATSCTLFGAVSGSTQATVVAVGSPLRPKLLKAGYSDSFSLALIINSSDIAFLIPPSIGFIIYGVISGTSIAELFIAGIGPGVMILMMFSIYCLIYAYINKAPPRKGPAGENGGSPSAKHYGLFSSRSSLLVVSTAVFSALRRPPLCACCTPSYSNSWCSAR